MNSRSSLRMGGLLTIANLLATVSVAQTADIHGLTYDGSATALESLDGQINAARTNSAKASAIAADLLAELSRPDTTVAARQAICQRLGWLLPAQNGPSLPKAWAPLVQMLHDPATVESARLALEPVPGSAVDAVFVDALKQSGANSSVRVALVQSAERRHIAAAVPVIAPWVNDADATTATAVARALGAIGTRAAVQALQSATNVRTPAISIALLAALNRQPTTSEALDPNEARQIAETLAAAPTVPSTVKASAWEYLLQHDTDEQKLSAITAALHGSDRPVKEAAGESIATCHADQLTQRLAQELPSFDAPTQIAVIGALGRRGDPTATSAIVGALTHSSAEVRLEAIEALGQLPGSRPAAAALLKVISENSAIEETKAAKLSLARMSGREPDAEIVAAAKNGEPKTRVAAIEQLSLRNVVDALPLLRELRSAGESTVRSAAAAAIGDIGPISDQSLLTTWALQAADEDERSHVLRGLVTLTRRIHRANAAEPIWRALEAAAPDVQIHAMPVLARLGDIGSAACAAKLATGSNPAVAAAAANTLARWSDATALDAQVTVATKATDAAVRRTAFNAAIAAIDRAVDHWTPARTDAVNQLAMSSPDEANSLTLLRLLRRANDTHAEKVAEELGRDAKLAAAARECIEAIQSNRNHRLNVTTSGGWGLADMLDGNPGTNWSIAATAGQWVQIDFGQTRPVSRLVLDEGSRTENMPGNLDVFVTDDPAKPGNAVKTQAGQVRRTTVDLPAGTRGRYVILRNTTERVDGYWSIAELIVE